MASRGGAASSWFSAIRRGRECGQHDAARRWRGGRRHSSRQLTSILAVPDAGRLPTGGARLTDGRELPGRRPRSPRLSRWPARQLADCSRAYRRSLEVADHGLRSVLSLHLHGCVSLSIGDAAGVAVRVVASFLEEQPGGLDLVRFVSSAPPTFGHTAPCSAPVGSPFAGRHAAWQGDSWRSQDLPDGALAVALSLACVPPSGVDAGRGGGVRRSRDQANIFYVPAKLALAPPPSRSAAWLGVQRRRRPHGVRHLGTGDGGPSSSPTPIWTARSRSGFRLRLQDRPDKDLGAIARSFDQPYGRCTLTGAHDRWRRNNVLDAGSLRKVTEWSKVHAC